MKPSCTKYTTCLPASRPVCRIYPPEEGLSAGGGQAGKDMNLAIAVSRPKGVIKHEGSMVFKIQK